MEVWQGLLIAFFVMLFVGWLWRYSYLHERRLEHIRGRVRNKLADRRRLQRARNEQRERKQHQSDYDKQMERTLGKVRSWSVQSSPH
jgi:hypothetical protein